MAIFSRRVARQRLRQAAQQSLSTPIFAPLIDYSSWITGGLWPAELSAVTAQTATVADRLRADLQRITDGANAELNQIRRTAPSYAERKTREERVVTQARQLAVRRVESTVRQLGGDSLQSGSADPRGGGPPDLVHEAPVPAALGRSVGSGRRHLDNPPPCDPAPDLPTTAAAEHFPMSPPEAARDRLTFDDGSFAAADVAPQSPFDDQDDQGGGEVVAPTGTRGAFSQQSDTRSGLIELEPPVVDRCADTEEAITSVFPASSASTPDAAAPEEQVLLPPTEPNLTGRAAEHMGATGDVEGGQLLAGEPAVAAEWVEPDTDAAPSPSYIRPALDRAATAWAAQPAATDAAQHIDVVVEAEAPADAAAPADSEAVPGPGLESFVDDAAAQAAPRRHSVDQPTDDGRLQLLLTFVARQEPGLTWAFGVDENGTTMLTTDLAHGWIPPNIVLPAGVHLLPPARREGSAAELLGPTAKLVVRAPGDRLDWVTDLSRVESSLEPRELPAVGDLGWQLRDATHWRDGLPDMVNTLAAVGAAGTGISEIELALLRVHHDTAMYELLADSPTRDTTVLLNALLLFATESLARGDRVSANYHFSWFQVLNTQT